MAGLLGNLQRARELGLKIDHRPGSPAFATAARLDAQDLPPVGNLLDNAFEASLRSDKENQIVELFLSDEGDDAWF